MATLSQLVLTHFFIGLKIKGVVNAVFSDRMLDPRIIYKCAGLNYVEREGADSSESSTD